MKDFSEDILIEQPAIKLFQQLGWDYLNCFDEKFGDSGTLGRETSSEVILVSKLKPALKRLNPHFSEEILDLAVQDLTRDRSVMSMEAANQEVYKLLKDGIKVTIQTPSGEQKTETVKIMDWEDKENNDFFLASQFWITGQVYKRRADLIGFVNGIPLVFIELKASHKHLENAYKDNLRDYKNSIPQLFVYNAFVILSNGSKSVISSVSAEWEHFNEWKKINNEGEAGIVSLDTILRGTCEQKKLLDLVENFILFQTIKGSIIKIIAKNHQYLGVNDAFESVKKSKENEGKIGVFWHTQGSGKSFSMIFFAQKVLRKLPGNHTFLVVTDRTDLDSQIYDNFADVGAVTEPEELVRADSGALLKQLLKEDHRFLFTLIQKFHTKNGQKYPLISERSDIIVMTDEAHRTQYDVFALNMRTALPNASFIGFTGTPLIAGEEKTRDVFGDYISIYNFKESADDKATVPLHYENRIPELQLTNENLSEDMENLLEEAELNPDQEKKLSQDFSREYHLITRDDRLEKIAHDIVSHFMGRGYLGKAMVVCVDKATTVKMYNKVQRYWKIYLQNLEEEFKDAKSEEKEELKIKIAFMQETDMAVVVSSAQNEVEDLREQGVDIVPHRKRMIDEALDTKFKDNNNPFRLVFVCSMWMTGFDVPSCSTIYLDKPLKNHTLMQTIARVNRVYKGKTIGLIVDYIGIFKNLQKALAIYGTLPGGGTAEGELPIKDKLFLVDSLRKIITETREFCDELDINLTDIERVEGFEKVSLLDDAVENILIDEETKVNFVSKVNEIDKVYKAILPDPSAIEFSVIRSLLNAILDKIRVLSPTVDISEVMNSVNKLLDESISTTGYIIHEPQKDYQTNRYFDLSKVDFDGLREKFAKGRKRTEIERIKRGLTVKLEEMVKLNNSRIDYLEKFKKLIDEYNKGSRNIEELFDALVSFTKELQEEEKRSIKENLSEEELAVFDILTKPNIELSDKERKQVKKVAKELLDKLKEEKLVLDWRSKQQTRADVKLTIQNILDQLPENYDRSIYSNKCEQVYLHIYETYFGQGKSIYS